MLLSHRHKFIYTKTVKTAGTSVEIYFQDACIATTSTAAPEHHTEQNVNSAGIVGYRGGDPAGRSWYNHMSAKEIFDLVGPIIWNEYFKFCIVRNPFDKMVSLWWFIQSKEKIFRQQRSFPEIKSDFSRWCIGHAPHAVDRDKYLIGNKVSMDFFIRFENLLYDLETVCQRVAYPFRPELLGTFKSDARILKQPFADYYDRNAIAAVEAAFDWEFRHFGYPRLSEIGLSS